MKKTVTIIVILAVGFVIGNTIGQYSGQRDAAVEDYRVYSAWLISYNSSPQTAKIDLNEFLKARYYYYGNRVSASVLGDPYDFGAVDFIGPAIGKDLTSPKHEYEIFKERKGTFQKPFERQSNEKGSVLEK